MTKINLQPHIFFVLCFILFFNYFSFQIELDQTLTIGKLMASPSTSTNNGIWLLDAYTSISDKS